MLLAAAGLSGCIFTYQGDCPDPRLVVRFDWTDAPTANPEGMGVLLYPNTGAAYWRFDFRPQGGTVDIDAGTYSVITFNNDTEKLLFEADGSYATLCATTREARITDGLSLTYDGAMPPARTDAEPVMAQPDIVWSATITEVNVGTETTDTVTLRPRQIVATYTVVVDSVINRESATQMCMAVSGLSVARVFADPEPVDKAVTVPAPISVDGDRGLCGSLYTFGRSPSAAGNTLSLYFWLRDGRKQLYQFDVSPQVVAAPDPLNVLIHIAQLKLPIAEAPPGPGGGVNVGVDNWETVDIELSN